MHLTAQRIRPGGAAGGEAGPDGRTARLATVIRTLGDRNEPSATPQPNPGERTKDYHAVVAHFQTEPKPRGGET